MPVYSAPQQRKPLTDEQIDVAATRHLGIIQTEDFDRESRRRREFARAIERAITGDPT